MTLYDVHVIGGGLAGAEACWQLANRGVRVLLSEMRGVQGTFAHQTDDLAELVCSNSFRSDDHTTSAIGVLHQEMRLLNSLILHCADSHKLPAGGALAVDRQPFAQMVTAKITAHPYITVQRRQVTTLPCSSHIPVLVATGPLTSDALVDSIVKITDADSLYFFDAIAPIVHFDSIDLQQAWFQSRYDKGDGNDYINCPMDETAYKAFVTALTTAAYTPFKEWEKNTPYFEGCLPIEVMAARGVETLRYGPMKPVGLTSPHTGKPAHAVVQLRRDNASGSLWNMVGFQTKMTYGEQQRIFRTISGLENAEFARLGGIHRNTFINSPTLLTSTMALKSAPHIYCAGQLTGVEGYVESAAMGLLAGRFIAAHINGERPRIPPKETAIGALLAHITGDAVAESFQPMNINFGLMPEVPLQTTANGKRRKLRGRERKMYQAERALQALTAWLDQNI